MTDINTTVERIKSANAVPSTDSFPTDAWSSADLLARIDERNKTMTDTLTPVRKLDPSKPPGRARGPLIALAVAAVVILVLGVVGLNVLTGDEPDVIEPVPTTTTVTPTTTTAPTTTAAPIESILPPDTPPLEVVAALADRWNNGDIAGGWELFHPDTESFLGDSKPGIDQELYYRYATRMESASECEVRTPPQLQDLELRVEGAQIVTCVDTITSGLDPAGFVAGGTWAISVADGWIHDFFIVDFVGALTETQGLNAYRDWMQVQRFSEGAYEELFDQTSLAINIGTPEVRQKHRDLIPAFLGDTGPRGELALPADTSFEEVVRVFLDRWDAGDVEGWAALFHPANNYSPPAEESAASYFIEVTGATNERECETITSETLATQIRCIDRQISGLAPGVVGDDVVVVYTGDVGWIWGIDFPNGAPPTFSNVTDAAGVAEYTAWVQDNRPAEFATLFSGGILMRLDTEEVRNLHKTTIAEYLAATS